MGTVLDSGKAILDSQEQFSTHGDDSLPYRDSSQNTADRQRFATIVNQEHFFYIFNHS
jgi:hypothetical protein